MQTAASLTALVSVNPEEKNDRRRPQALGPPLKTFPGRNPEYPIFYTRPSEKTFFF